MKTTVYPAIRCPSCTRAAAAPYRVYDARGKVVNGCIDHFHTGYLQTPSESAKWHNRPVAKMRAEEKVARHGGVSELMTREEETAYYRELTKNYIDPTMLSALFDDKFVKENVVSESVNPDTLSN